MLKIIVPAGEMYDAESNTFITTKETTLVLEHSLLSISKWEAAHKRCFLYCMSPKSDDKISPSDFIDYVRCMTINQNVDSKTYLMLSRDNIRSIIDYMNDRACATTVWHTAKNAPSSRRMKDTAEVIYYYMFTAGIPIECEKWHINRLLTLIDVCATLGGGKKMSQAETAAMYSAMNAARRNGRSG